MTKDADLLFHGTSSSRLTGIVSAGQIDPAPSGDQHVSLTDDIEVAAYFANLASDADEDATPVILVIEGGKVEALPFSSDVWGKGACDWEREYASLKPVALEAIKKIEKQDPRPLNSFDHLRNAPSKRGRKKR